MRNLGWRSLLAPALSFAALTACAGDGAGPVGTGDAAAVPLASHTANVCDHDVAAPVISSVTASPSVLWPPNHKWVNVSVAIVATDDLSPAGAIRTRVTHVTSSEPVNWRGDGNTAPDWEVTGPYSVRLRSERSGLNAGRTYTIHVEAIDACGRRSTSFTTVFVPHDQGKRGR